MNSKIEEIVLKYANSVIVFLFLSVLVTSTRFLFGYSFLHNTFWIALFGTAIFLIFSTKNGGIFRKILSGFVYSLVLFLMIYSSCSLASRYLDSSFDGRDYHMDDLFVIKNGWNPVSFKMLNPQDQLYSRYYRMYYFTKGVEIYQTVLYDFFDKIEYAKGIIFVLASAVIIYGYIVFRRVFNLNPIVALFVSLSVVLNPVVICQTLNYYIDGNSYLLFCCVVFLSLILIKKNSIALILAYVFSFALFSSSKLTSFVYGFVWIFGMFLIWMWLGKLRSGNNLIILSVLGFLISVFVFCFNPFITTIRDGMPILFPIQHDYDALLKLNMPENLLYKNRVERLVLGVFSESSTERIMGTSSRLKIPFSVQPGELFSFANPDTIMGGWGAWAGGIFILFMFGFVYMICKNNYSIETKLSLLCFFAILLSCLSTPIPNNSRFTPQVWLLFVFGLVAILQYGSKIMRIVSILVGLFLIINIYSLSETYIRYNRAYTDRVRAKTQELLEYSKNNKVYFKPKYFYSEQIRLKEAGVRFDAFGSSNMCVKPVRIFEKEFPDMSVYSCP